MLPVKIFVWIKLFKKWTKHTRQANKQHFSSFFIFKRGWVQRNCWGIWNFIENLLKEKLLWNRQAGLSTFGVQTLETQTIKNYFKDWREWSFFILIWPFFGLLEKEEKSRFQMSEGKVVPPDLVQCHRSGSSWSQVTVTLKTSTQLTHEERRQTEDKSLFFIWKK